MNPGQSIYSKSFDFTGDGVDLWRLLRGEPYVFFLDSGQNDLHRGRFSFIGYDPFDVFSPDGAGALGLLRQRWREYVPEHPCSFKVACTPLAAGMVGCLSYDHGLYFEEIRRRPAEEAPLPDCHFGFYDRMITVDHLERKVHITSTGLPERNDRLREGRARRRLAETVALLAPLLGGDSGQNNDSPKWDEGYSPSYAGNFTRAQYMRAVRKALDYIARGDIYQVNLSQRFRYDVSGHGFDPVRLYTLLHKISPAPFGAFMDCGQFQLISNSPERFLRLDGRVVQTRPMKGTRPRGRDAAQDRMFRDELAGSDKEKAELLMITDLQRNDLGKVCEYGSVRVKEIRTLEEYPYVFQATSTVEGELRAGLDGFDVLRACFPGGSITGCPKIRAMEIIEELEPSPRGMYTGSLGYIGFDGGMDFNILIRTLIVRADRLDVHVGAGIVADSTPEEEYAETLVKAGAIQHCLRASLAGGGAGDKALR